MDRGRLIEDGRWEELLAQQGSFATLARQQHELS
jgi:ABC-type multidrug transport system fused ATPase/permease subunit